MPSSDKEEICSVYGTAHFFTNEKNGSFRKSVKRFFTLAVIIELHLSANEPTKTVFILHKYLIEKILKKYESIPTS